VRSDLFAGALLLAALGGCNKGGGDAASQATTGASAGRIDAVQTQAKPIQDARGFCEKTYPAAGPDARKYAPPPERPLPGAQPPAAAPAGAHWTWVNLWATWCHPCMEEMGLLTRWRDAFAREGVPLAFDLVSVDAADAGETLQARIQSGLPGSVRWLRGQDDLGPFLDSLGVDRSAAIPIHALVDPQGMLRCVRVGAIHPEDYPTVKTLIGG
jgi:thiol-disulfide isomerase/thioredoxin